jgi:hypothetical protein
VLLKIKQINSKLLDTDSYQAGFKEGRSCHNNMAAVLSRLKHQKRYSSQRGIAVFVDLQKAYDTVPRDRMILNLWKERILGGRPPARQHHHQPAPVPKSSDRREISADIQRSGTRQRALSTTLQ